uniref:Polyprotein n=1 Tax=Barley aphid RNA virus 10 TaxID=2713139 RepID=A0A6F8QHE9_9VIRU|nr:polyprotein [Barley aphid RNA virus 10]
MNSVRASNTPGRLVVSGGVLYKICSWDVEPPTKAARPFLALPRKTVSNEAAYRNAVKPAFEKKKSVAASSKRQAQVSQRIARARAAKVNQGLAKEIERFEEIKPFLGCNAIIAPKVTSHKEVTPPPSPKRERRYRESDYRPLVAAALAQPKIELKSIWGSGDAVTKLELGPETEFTERPKPTRPKPVRVLAKPAVPSDEKVLDEFKVTSTSGGTLTIRLADFRIACRNADEPVAVASSRDLNSTRNGRWAPLTYLYEELNYPRPTVMDYANSHVTIQGEGGKTVYTVMTKEVATASDNLDGLYRGLRQLKTVMDIHGDKPVSMPFMCVTQKGIQVRQLVNGVIDILVHEGKNITMYTDYRGVFYTAKAVLKETQKTVDEHATDESTPQDWQPVEGDKHHHNCYSCGCLYSHWHKHYNVDHPQFDRQCPNSECKEYHRGKNFTNSQLVDLPADEEPSCRNSTLLQDPNWIKEASVFPAAIETAVEGLSKFFDHAFSLLPAALPEVKKEEVIQLKKTGYAGAVSNKTRLKLIIPSSLIGLNEKKPRKVKELPKPEEPKFVKNYSTSNFNPNAMPKDVWVPKGEEKGFLAVSGRDAEYVSAYFRMTGTRRQHKASARRARQWVRDGCDPAFANRYIHLQEEACGPQPVPEIVDGFTYYPEDHAPRPIRKPKVKVTFTDDFWMDYFAHGLPLNISYEYPRNLNRCAKRLGLKARHLLREKPEAILDIVGPISKLSEPTERVYVISDTDEIIPCSLSTRVMPVSVTVGDHHQSSNLRSFRYDGNLKSGSPIFNATMQVCSIVTASKDGEYVLQHKHSTVEEYPCLGEHCTHCKIERELIWHDPKNNAKPKRKAQRPKRKQNNAQKVANATGNAVELRLRTEQQQIGIAEVTNRLKQIEINSRRVKSLASSLTAPLPKSSNALGNKAPRHNRKPKAKSGIVASAISKLTGGMVSGTTSAGVTALMTVLIVFLSCLLPTSVAVTSIGCFRGFNDQYMVAGEVICNQYLRNESYQHYLDPSLGGSYDYINIVSADADRGFWDRVNQLISDAIPARIVLSKVDNTAVINGDIILNDIDSTGLSKTVLYLQAVLAVLLALTFIKWMFKVSAPRYARANSPYNNNIVVAAVVLFVIAAAVAAPSTTTTPSPVNTEELANKVEHAKGVIDEITAWMKTPGKATLNNLKQRNQQLVEIEKLLVGMGEPGDNNVQAVAHLKSSLATRMVEVGKLVETVRNLNNDIAALRKRILELEKSSNEAKVAFEQYKDLFKRSAEISSTGLEDITAQDLQDDIDLLENNKSDLMNKLARYERSTYKGTETVTNDNRDRYNLLPANAETLNKAENTVASSQQKREANSNATEAPTKSSDKPIHSIGRAKSSGVVPESALKVKFNAEALTPCDGDNVKWDLFDNYKECDTHPYATTMVGLGYNGCAIGTADYRSDKIVVKKVNDKKYRCSVACFKIDDIVRALRFNMGNEVCFGPLFFGGHWKLPKDEYETLNDFQGAKNPIILSGKALIIKSDGSVMEFTLNSGNTISECCGGWLADSVSEDHIFYDGPCVCKANMQNVEKRIKNALVEYYEGYARRVPMVFSYKTISSVAVIVITAMMSPGLAVCVGLSMFMYNAYADCSIKNYHTLYVGDSSSKQIYSTLYMQKGDCFTLGENTFELLDIDNVYKYKRAAAYPTEFGTLCTDIDWGCGLAEGSKICSDYKKDCENKCKAASNTIYKKHCIATTTFHGDGCFGFLVQDHQVYVHGGVCLVTDASKPYYGYSKVEGLYSKKFTFKVSGFDQSRTITIDSKNLIYEDNDFTIQDIAVQKDRIPTYVLDAGSIMCAYSDVTGNDFCHSVVNDTSKLTNPGCVNLDWTFLGNDATWEIDDTSAVITPYVFDLFETCDTENITKNGEVLEVSPRGLTLSFKIDSQYKTSAFKVSRCAKVSLGGHDSIPGFVNRVQSTVLSVALKADSECYVSLRLSTCSLIGVNYCKVGADETTCSWTVYCSAILDATATLVGADDLASFNFTSGKFSAPTIEYSRTLYSSASGMVGKSFSTVVASIDKVLSYFPGFSWLKWLLSFSVQKFVVILLIFLFAYGSWEAASPSGVIFTMLFAWVYFCTDYIHADDGSAADESFDLKLWHLLVFLLFSAVDWVKLIHVCYAHISRKASGWWHDAGCDNKIVGIPLVDSALYLTTLVLFPRFWHYIVSCYTFSQVLYRIHFMLTRPQSVLFNTEQLNHTPLAMLICSYISNNCCKVPEDEKQSFEDLVKVNARSLLNFGQAATASIELGCHMFNSPSSDEENEPIEITFQPEEDSDNDEFSDALLNITPMPSRVNNSADISQLATASVSIHPDCMWAENDDNSSPVVDTLLSAWQDELEEVTSEPKPLSDYAFVVSPTLVENPDNVKQVKPIKGKPLPKDQKILVLHPMLAKHAEQLRLEVVRLGFKCDPKDRRHSDIIIATKPNYAENSAAYFFNVVYSDNHLNSLNCTKDQYDICLALYHARNYAKHFILKNSKSETLLLEACSFLDPTYKIEDKGKKAPHHYVVVPVAGGFDDLDTSTTPGYVMVPKVNMTTEEKEIWSRDLAPQDMVIVPQKYKRVPKNWVYVATVYINNEKHMRSALNSGKYPRSTHSEYVRILKSLKSDPKAIAVNALPSLVSALNIIYSSAMRRKKDLAVLSRPELAPVFKRINNLDEVDTCCVYYSLKAEVGDFVKLSVAGKSISVYKSDMSEFVNETSRTFMAFRFLEPQKVGSYRHEFGHCEIVGNVLVKAHLDDSNYCVRHVFTKFNHILYVVANRRRQNEPVNLDVLEKGMKSAKIQAIDTHVEHIYVAFADNKVRKFFNKVIPLIVTELSTKGIEITILAGKHGDIRTICSHVNSALKIVANGEPISIDTSISVEEESTRKDRVTRLLREAASASADSSEFVISVKYLKDERGRNTIIFKRGKVDEDGWRVYSTDLKFTCVVRAMYENFKEPGYVYSQPWLYDADNHKILGLLPITGCRPAHFNITFSDTDLCGDDLVSGDYEGPLFAPMAGKKDKGGRCTYVTRPARAQDGSLVHCIYTTELPGYLGKPLVVSEKRLMSGAEIRVMPEELDQECYPQGVITKCSRTKYTEVYCYVHRLDDQPSLRSKFDVPDYLNPATRFTLANIKSAAALLDIFKRPVLSNFVDHGNPTAEELELRSVPLVTENAVVPNDVLISCPEVVLADLDNSGDAEWYSTWSNFNFSKAEIDMSSLANRDSLTFCPKDIDDVNYSHATCSVHTYTLEECKTFDTDEVVKKQEPYYKEKWFCTKFCGQVYSTCLYNRSETRKQESWGFLSGPRSNVNNIEPLFTSVRRHLSHPCLPELERLCNALSHSDFDRVKWYDHILENIDDDNVFISFQLQNRKRFNRFCRELDATCSTVFDFPDTFVEGTWCTPNLKQRCHISWTASRRSCISVDVTSDTSDRHENKPITIKVELGRDQPDSVYVSIRRALALLLAQGWNAIDLILDDVDGLDIHRIIHCCMFNISVFGVCTINIVSTDKKHREVCERIIQNLPNLVMIPPELTVGSKFLFNRGVKTAAILESIKAWERKRPIPWIAIDVSKQGLPMDDCPEIAVSAESRPDFMGDSMCSIWNITNGMSIGSCYANGMDLVGSNHCTLGNPIVVETATPHGFHNTAKRAKYVSKIAKSFINGDIDMHNNVTVFTTPRKGEIYCTINPAQRRGRWLMTTEVDTYDAVMKTNYNKFVPVEVNFAREEVKLEKYGLYKGLSGSPIINAKGQCMGIYGLSTNVNYSDKSIGGGATNTTMCHSMTTDNVVESEQYFVEAARELVCSNVNEWRFCYLEAPTGTGKSTLFPLAILDAVTRQPGVSRYNICMLEPTRAAVHNCYNRVLSTLEKGNSKWKKLYTLRLSTGKRGDTSGDSFKTEGTGKIQLCISTYGRFIAEYQPDSLKPHNFDMLLMDEIHTRSNDEDVGTAFLLSSDKRGINVKICYMTATAVGKVCEKRLCEGKDLVGTRYKIQEENIIETKRVEKREDSILTDSSYFTIDLRKAKLNLRTKAQYVSWPLSSHANGRCLIFLPSRNDCEKFVGWAKVAYPTMKERFTSLHAGSKVGDLNTLHPEAIIGCTDYASTAITVPNCKAVVDFMEDWSPSVTLYKNDEGFHYKNTVSKDVVSKQVSVQRKGRTGRTCNGTYFSCASITPVEETKLSESMYARIYFNLLIKMGSPHSLQGLLQMTEEANRIYEHDWLEPDNLRTDWSDRYVDGIDGVDRLAAGQFVTKATRRLQVVREWDKDQLWWYLNPIVGQDYVSFCFASENEATHGFGQSANKVNLALKECWTIVDTTEEAEEVRHRLGFHLESYKEDMNCFDNYVQRAHDVVGAVSIDTLAKRAQKTSKKMYDSIDKTVLNLVSDAAENVRVEASEEDREFNRESFLGVSLGAGMAAAAIGALVSAGIYTYQRSSTWTAVEVYAVERSELADAIYTSMKSYALDKITKPVDEASDAVVSTIDRLILYVKEKWNDWSGFFKELISKMVSKHPPGMNHESAFSGDVTLAAVVAALTSLKTIIVSFWHKHGALRLGPVISSLGLGAIYGRMCDVFGIVFSNAIVAMIMAMCSIVVGPIGTVINCATMVVTYIISGLITFKPSQYGGTLAARAGALLFTTGGASALAFLLQGAHLGKNIVSSPVNVTSGLIAMVNPYNTGVSRVSDGIIIAKMIANMCKREKWTAADGLAVGSTLMSMLFRADAMTCMVSATAGLFLGFARIYMSNTEFWFKMTSAMNIKHADAYKDMVSQQIDRFDFIFDSILSAAGLLANPMSIISIIANIMADITIAYMRNEGDIEYGTIATDSFQFYSGVSMIYGISSAVFKLCSQLRNSVSSHFERSSDDAGVVSLLLSQLRQLIDGFSLGTLIEKVKEICLHVFPTMQFNLSSCNIVFTLVSQAWDFIKGIFDACYNWCADKVSTAWNRAEKRITDKISSATSIGFSMGSSISSDPSPTRAQVDAHLKLKYRGAAYLWVQHLNCPLSHYMIADNMERAKHVAEYRNNGDEFNAWKSVAALFGWCCNVYQANYHEMTQYIRHKMKGIELTDENMYPLFSEWCLQFLVKRDLATAGELTGPEASGRFDEATTRDDASVFDELDNAITMEDEVDHMQLVDDRTSTTTERPVSPTISEASGVCTDDGTIERILGSIVSEPYDFTWLSSCYLAPEGDDKDHYDNVDHKFWIKLRLRDTGENCISALYVQAVENRCNNFGPMPNRIVALNDSIYFKPDTSFGSGDYIKGSIFKPWDILCLDNDSMAKFFTTGLNVADNGTHVTLMFNMADDTNMHVSVSHSFTERAACTGLLIQRQDKATKLVCEDIASVEIFFKPTRDGIVMLGTCPPSTGGAWDQLYSNYLKYLPFFRDLKYQHVKMAEAKATFDDWCNAAAPTNDNAELLDFENWKDMFLKRRFVGMGAIRAIKSAVTRRAQAFLTKYNTSLQETKQTFDIMKDPKRYTDIFEVVKYKSYYDDFTQSMFNRVGDTIEDTRGLPYGISDTRIPLNDYAVCAWFKELAVSSDEVVYDSTQFTVVGKVLDYNKRIHHPAAYYPIKKALQTQCSTLYLPLCKSELVRHGYICGYNVLFIDALGESKAFELSGCAGVCGCTAVYMFAGSVLHSVQSWKCDQANCADTCESWVVYTNNRDVETHAAAVEELQQRQSSWNHESGGWLSSVLAVTTKDYISAAIGVARKVIDDAIEEERLYNLNRHHRVLQDKEESKPELSIGRVINGEYLRNAIVTTDLPGRYVTETGFPALKADMKEARERQVKINHDKQINTDYDKATEFFFSPAAQKLFAYKRDLGDDFYRWIQDLAIEEKCNRILSKEGDNIITVNKAKELKKRYDVHTVEELLDMMLIEGSEREDIRAYLDISKRRPVCAEAPWCDGWDAVAVNSRTQDLWLTDGNMHLYTPHYIEDSNVISDIMRVDKMIHHVPKEVYDDCKYKNRMELPCRENDIGNVYASRAACKAQLLYEYLPGFFNNHKRMFEPCCGFGGFAQFFSHQMRNMEPREYYVSTLNRRGHALPNWSLMQAADGNCKVIRTLEAVADGDICDIDVNNAACKLIKDNDVTLLLSDIGEKFSNPNLDDAWYLATRNAKGKITNDSIKFKTGLSICTALKRMVGALPEGADAIFKVNTFSPRVADIIHEMSSSFRRVRALKLATTPEQDREFYLFCSNKRNNWVAPMQRSLLLKDCVKELTWSAIYRAENMHRTKGRHATSPRTHKWFTPDSSGVCYKLIPNSKSSGDELDATLLPQGHEINVSTQAHGHDIHVKLACEPDWNRRFRNMKNYVKRVNYLAKERTGRGRDNVKFDSVVRSDFTYVKGIGSYTTKIKNSAEKHGRNDIVSSYLDSVAGMNLLNATYGQTQGTPEYVKPSLKKRLDVQPGQPEPTCVIDYVKAVHCLMSDAGRGMLGKFRFMTKDETYAQIIKTGSTGILDPGSNLKEFMEIFPEWYELAWEEVLNPHLRGGATSSYQSVRIKPEPKGRKDAEEGRLNYKKGVPMDKLREGTNLSPRFIQFSDALSRIAHIIVFGHVLNFHGKQKLYKGSINGTPPHISGRVMRAYWDLHNPHQKRVVHVGNNPELDIAVTPNPDIKTDDVECKPLHQSGRLSATRPDEDTLNNFEDLPAGLTIDFSALDSTVTVSERMVMTDLWKRFFTSLDEKRIVEGVCKDMIYAMCLDDSGNIWVRDGQRGSGEILTSIENTWLVTANIISAMSHALGVSIDSLTKTQGHIDVLTRPGGCGSPKVNVRDEIAAGAPHKRFEFGDVPLLVDGDDVVIISSRRRINQIQAYMNQTRQWLSANRKVIRSGNKGGATRYLAFEELSFCSHRYEPVFIGPDASKYNPKYLPSSEIGRHKNRTDLLSVAEDRNFKIYFLPIRPVADILAKLMLTLKVKTFKWDKTKTGPGECMDLTQSKLISYILLYPQCRWVRYTCLTLLCVTGDTLATFTEFKKRYQDFSEFNLKHSSKLLASMNSLYGVSSLDDVSLREYRRDTYEIRKQQHNSRLTGHVCQITRGRWLQASFDWLSHQNHSDVYPLMWDSSVFKNYETHVSVSGDYTKVSYLKEMILQHAKFTETEQINARGLWWRIVNFTG